MAKGLTHFETGPSFVSIIEYLFALLVITLGAGVQATLGLGAALIAGPVLTVIDPDLLPGPMLAMATIVNFRNAIADRASIDVSAWKRAVVGAPLGLAFGILLLTNVEEGSLSVIVSTFVLIAAGLQFSGLKPPKGRLAEYLAGVATAFSSTVAAMPGPMFVVFYGHRKPPTVRGTLASFMLVSTPVILFLLHLDGRFGSRHLLLALSLAPGTFLGLQLGRSLRTKVSVAQFRPLVLGVACVSAISVLLKEIAI